MTVVMQCKNIVKEYGDIEVLKGINLEINQGEKIGIVGINGVGKTTFINILMKKLEPTSGEVLWNMDELSIGYMQQSTDHLGLNKNLSGGEKTKTILTKLLYNKYDVLVLDEPTNHLDAEGIEWLIKHLRAFKGTVIIISHDRYFMDKSIDKIVEIDEGRAKIYNGNYSWYRTEKRRQFEIQMHQYREQEKMKYEIQNQIMQLKNWSNKAHNQSRKKAIETGNKFGGKEHNRAKAKKMDRQIKSRIKSLERIEFRGVEKPVEETSVLFKINEAKKKGKVILEAKDISKHYGNKVLFEKSSFYIKRGEKIGLYGSNGCGKSTLIKAILKQIPFDGEIYSHDSREIGYISQDVSDLNEALNVLQLFKIENRVAYSHLRTELNKMGFKEDVLSKKIGVLSLGERMKLKLLQLIHQECEMLILDEPTNHIDLHVREQLEKVLEDYMGTIILVTHDRYMLEKICDKLLVFEKGMLRRHEYGISEYQNKKQNKSIQEKILLENKLAYTLGRLSQLVPDTEEYEKQDEIYKELIVLRNEHNL